MLSLLLVRHGITIWNQEGRRSGHTDIPLAPEGIVQAQRIAERLRNEAIDAIWSSDLERARVTAEIIAESHQLPVRTTPLLREVCHGALEGLTRSEVGGHDVASDPNFLRPPDAESYEEVWQRMIAARNLIQETHTEGSVLVVGHTGPLRMLLCDAIGATISARKYLCLDNASLSIIEYFDGQSRLRLLNDTYFLHG